jgi:hypothetical protein
MSTSGRLIGSVTVAAASAVVLAEVRQGVVDVADGVVLVGALVVLARTAIRLASDPAGTRQDDQDPHANG